VQLLLALRGVNVLVDAAGLPPSTSTVVTRFFSYFTVESNILVAFIAASLAVRPDRDGRVFRVLRLMALFGITVTGAVSATLLRGVVDLHGAAAVTNVLLHSVAPLMTVIGWLAFGPRRRITENTLLGSMVWPVLYVAWTVVHRRLVGLVPVPVHRREDPRLPDGHPQRRRRGCPVLLAGPPSAAGPTRPRSRATHGRGAPTTD